MSISIIISKIYTTISLAGLPEKRNNVRDNTPRTSSILGMHFTKLERFTLVYEISDFIRHSDLISRNFKKITHREFILIPSINSSTDLNNFKAFNKQQNQRETYTQLLT